MKKHYFKIISFLLCFILSFSSIPVYAESTASHGHFHTQEENKAFWELNFRMLVTDFLGFVTGADLYTPFLDNLKRKHQFETDSEAWAWLYDNTTVDNPDNPKEYHISNELKNDMQVFVNEYKADLDSQKAYEYKYTFGVNQVKGSDFQKYSRYQNFTNKLSDLCKSYDYVIAFTGLDSKVAFYYPLSVSSCGFLMNYSYDFVVTLLIKWEYMTRGTKTPVAFHNLCTNDYYQYTSVQSMWEDLGNREIEGFSKEVKTILDYSNNYTYIKGFDEDGNEFDDHIGRTELLQSTVYIDKSGSENVSCTRPCLYSLSKQKVKVFSSTNDLKDYQSNTVTYPYYMVTPTCSGNTITQSQIDNSVTYGDIDQSVTNIIINNGGITEEQLQRIIDAILAGKGGGSDPVTPVDPTDPVNPVDPTDPWVPPSFDFSGLLKGLMNLLAAIFGLIGNLVGYVAQLIADLVTSLNSVIDNIKILINQGVIGLFSALFPFLPPEITSLLSLTFLLVAIIAVIKAFRG